jgi:hypothetical protein
MELSTLPIRERIKAIGLIFQFFVGKPKKVKYTKFLICLLLLTHK